MAIAWKLVRNLFSRGLKSEELADQLKNLDNERQNLRYDQRALDKQRAAAFERAKMARKRSDNNEVVFHLQELKGLDTENKLLLSEISRVNKAAIILRQYKRRLERVERNSDYSQVVRLIERFRTSGAMGRIESADVNEEMFQEMLDEELEELDRDLGFASDFSTMDDGMKDKLDALDAVIEAEREGDDASARKAREALSIYESEALDDDEPLRRPGENEDKLATEGEGSGKG